MKAKIILLVLCCIAMANALAQRKLSQLPVWPVNDSVRLVGVETVSGVSTDYRYSIANLAAFIGSIGSQNISNTSLHWSGDYTQHLHKHSLEFEKLNTWVISDTNNVTLVNLNAAPVPGGMLFVNGNINIAGLQTKEGVSVANVEYASSVAHGNMRAGTTIFDMIQNNLFATIKATAGAGGNTWVLDSANNNFSVRHFTGNGFSPSITAGAGAGTGATISISPHANDISGYISLTTGAAPAASAAVFTVTFNIIYHHAPECVLLFPANAATQQMVATKQVFVDQVTTTTTTFAATSGATALTTGVAYKWYYLVVE